MRHYKRVLVLAPHPDDLEFGCGGTVARLLGRGSSVISVVGCKLKERHDEMLLASKILGIKKTVLMNVPIRNFNKYRQDILDRLISLKDRHSPDLVIMPCLDDIHQDHTVMSQEGIRAFKNISLWGYEHHWNNMVLKANLFIKLSPPQIAKKLKAIKCYASQKNKQYFDEEYQLALLRFCGMRAGIKYAEAFSVIREVVA